MKSIKLWLFQKQLFFTILEDDSLSISWNIHSKDNISNFLTSLFIRITLEYSYSFYIDLKKIRNTFPNLQVKSTRNLSLKLIVKQRRGALIGNPKGFLRSKSIFYEFLLYIYFTKSIVDLFYTWCIFRILNLKILLHIF